MLVLTRKIDEGILIGDNVEVKVVAIEGSKVKLGVVADKEISIVRTEILKAVKNENLAAGHLDEVNLNWGTLISRLEQK